MKALAIKFLPYVILGLLLFVGKCYYDNGKIVQGQMKAQLASKDSALLALRDQYKALESKHKTDTVVMNRFLLRWKTLPVRDSIIHDTLPVPVEVVKTIIVTADSTIKACTDALNSCEAIANNLRTRLTNTEGQRDIWRRKAQPPIWRRATNTTTKLVLGYLGGKLIEQVVK